MPSCAYFVGIHHEFSEHRWTIKCQHANEDSYADNCISDKEHAFCIFRDKVVLIVTLLVEKRHYYDRFLNLYMVLILKAHLLQSKSKKLAYRKTISDHERI